MKNLNLTLLSALLFANLSAGLSVDVSAACQRLGYDFTDKINKQELLCENVFDGCQLMGQDTDACETLINNQNLSSIKQAYRKAMIKVHPDKCATEECKVDHGKITAAYEAIKNGVARWAGRFSKASQGLMVANQTLQFSNLTKNILQNNTQLSSTVSVLIAEHQKTANLFAYFSQPIDVLQQNEDLKEITPEDVQNTLVMLANRLKQIESYAVAISNQINNPLSATTKAAICGPIVTYAGAKALELASGSLTWVLNKTISDRNLTINMLDLNSACWMVGRSVCAAVAGTAIGLLENKYADYRVAKMFGKVKQPVCAVLPYAQYAAIAGAIYCGGGSTMDVGKHLLLPLVFMHGMPRMMNWLKNLSTDEEVQAEVVAKDATAVSPAESEDKAELNDGFAMQEELCLAK